MSIKVNHIGALDIPPFKLEFDTGDCAVRELLRLASEDAKVDIIDELFEGEALKEGMVVLANGYNISAQEGLDTVAKDGSQVLITTLLYGG